MTKKSQFMTHLEKDLNIQIVVRCWLHVFFQCVCYPSSAQITNTTNHDWTTQ